MRNKTLVAFEQANIGRQDRISQLPDHILQNIIFYLQQIELERYVCYSSSVLNFVLSSKACHQAWLFHPHPSFFGMRYHDDESVKEKAFRDNLEQSVLRMMSHGLDITSFSLHTKLSKPMHLTSWLQGLDALKLKIIQLDFLNRKFKMTMSLFSYISTLEEISLHNCILESNQYRNQEVRLPSLLRLRMVDVDADSNTVEGVIRGCPSLNQPEILFVYFVPDIDGNVYALDIDAPCLRKFSCKWTRNVVPCFSVSSCSDLKELSLTGTYVVNDKTLEKLLSQLTNLECLSITNSHRMSNPCISSFSITKLKLDESTISGVMRIDCPNLHEFSYHTYTVPHLHHQSTWDWKLSLYLRGLSYQRSRTNRFFEKLGSFISDTKINITRLKLEIRDIDSFDKRHELNMKVIPDGVFVPWPQLTKLKHLKLRLRDCLDFPSEILDGFLWICHPDFITCTFHDLTNGSLKMLLPSIRKVAQKKGVRFKCGCVDGNVSDECWHHSLSHVNLEWCGITQHSYAGVEFHSVGLDGLSQLAMSDSMFFNVRLTELRHLKLGWIYHSDFIAITLSRQPDVHIKWWLPSSIKKVVKKIEVRFKCACFDNSGPDR